MLPCMPCYFLDLLILLVSSCVLCNVGSSDDPICVHFAFKIKFYIMYYLWGSSPILSRTILLCFLVWSISGFMFLEVWSIRFGILCHHEKFGEFGLLVGTLLFLGVGFVLLCDLLYIFLVCACFAMGICLCDVIHLETYTHMWR